VKRVVTRYRKKVESDVCCLDQGDDTMVLSVSVVEAEDCGALHWSIQRHWHA